MAGADKRYKLTVYYTDGEVEQNENVQDMPYLLEGGVLAAYQGDGVYRHYVLRYVQSYTVEVQQ